MKTLRLTLAESRAYAAGERAFWRAMKPQPVTYGQRHDVRITPRQDSSGDWLLERWPKQDRSMLNFGRCDIIPRCSYGTPGDRIELTMRDCPGAVQHDIRRITVTQIAGKWGWMVEVGA